MTETILAKDTIQVIIHDDHSFECATVTIGRSGENNITQLEITIPEELNGFNAYLDFKKPKGAKYKTAKLEIENNKIEYDVPLELLDESGNLEVQLVLQNEQGLIWKSAIKKFVVLGSVDAVEGIVAKEDFITKVEMLLEEMKNRNTMAKIDEVTLLANAWVGEDEYYTQVVEVKGITPTCDLEFRFTDEQIGIFYNKEVTLKITNNNGVAVVSLFGQKLVNDYTLQVKYMEVEYV